MDFSNADVKREVRRLDGLSDDGFLQEVERELRSNFSEIKNNPVENERFQLLRTALLQPELVVKWQAALSAMKIRAETFLGSRESGVKKFYGKIPMDQYIQKRNEFDQWRERALKKLADIQDRLMVARAKRDEYFGYLHADTRIAEERNRLSELNLRLTNAIITHRERVTADYDPTELDHELWKIIEPNGRTNERTAERAGGGRHST